MVRAVIGHQVTAIRRPRLGQPAHSLLGLLSLGPRSKQGPKTGSTAPSPPSPWARNRGPVLKGPRDLRPARAELRPRPRRAGTRLGHRPFARGVEAGLWAERGAKGAAASRLCRAGPGVRPGVSLPSGSRLGRLRSRHVMYPRSRGENCYFSLPSPRKATTVGTLGQVIRGS
ncbi:CST complex subunit TEN1 isoform X2 [Notamacropus eugenii]|uniref:CST complex subunit TEN1 isoform X2 n=1 Tax=Notamacropus eugenii TaxID=9315 RepID=UPI003B66B7E1